MGAVDRNAKERKGKEREGKQQHDLNNARGG
jgi:hypothetical protein